MHKIRTNLDKIKKVALKDLSVTQINYTKTITLEQTRS